MARITKLELTQINTRLAAELAEVRSELAMLKLDFSIAMEHGIFEPAPCNHQLVEAQPEQRSVANAMMDRGEAAPTPRLATRRGAPVPTITRYTDGMGRVWEKTRLGNAATSRCISERAQ